MLLDIIHLDIKPENFVFVKTDWKIIDFGIAKELNDKEEKIYTDECVGTLIYMSPEQLTRDPEGRFLLSRASDIWSLGIVLFQMETATVPFYDDDKKALVRKILEGHFQPNDMMRSEVLSIVKRCLSLHAESRPSAAILMNDDFL